GEGGQIGLRNLGILEGGGQVEVIDQVDEVLDQLLTPGGGGVGQLGGGDHDLRQLSVPVLGVVGVEAQHTGQHQGVGQPVGQMVVAPQGVGQGVYGGYRRVGEGLAGHAGAKQHGLAGL